MYENALFALLFASVLKQLGLMTVTNSYFQMKAGNQIMNFRTIA